MVRRGVRSGEKESTYTLGTRSTTKQAGKQMGEPRGFEEGWEMRNRTSWETLFRAQNTMRAIPINRAEHHLGDDSGKGGKVFQENIHRGDFAKINWTKNQRQLREEDGAFSLVL